MLVSWAHQKDELEKYAKRFDKSCKLIVKEDSKLMQFLARVLAIISFGAIKRDTFMYSYAITLGNRQYYPEFWRAEQVKAIIPHESRHVKQFRWFGLGIHPILGIPLMFLFYSILFFPVGLALFRVLLEIDADKQLWIEEFKRQEFWSQDYAIGSALTRSRELAGRNYLFALPYKLIEKLYFRAINSTRDKLLKG